MNFNHTMIKKKKKMKRFKLTHENVMLHNSKSMNKISTQVI